MKRPRFASLEIEKDGINVRVVTEEMMWFAFLAGLAVGATIMANLAALKAFGG